VIYPIRIVTRMMGLLENPQARVEIDVATSA
jgi:hypothetical protein